MSDDEYHRLLREFPEKVRGALTWRTYFQRLINAGRRTGRSDLEIGDDIRREYQGEIPDVTLRKSLPGSFKHQEFANRPKAIKIIASEPDIPPPPEVHKEAEIIPEQAPAKPIEEPIRTQPKVIEFIFAPKSIDMVDTSQAFLIHLDITTGEVKQYKTVGRRTKWVKL